MGKTKMRLLLIDDDEVNNYLFIKKAKEQKLAVSCSTASNGKKALRKLAKIVETNVYDFPDIILVDIQMPVMGGFEFLDHYQELYMKDYPNTIVFMVSGSIKTEDRTRAKSYASVSNYITKPFNMEALREIISYATPMRL
ncbi:MAG: response regulator [Bacteroidota bacterium]